MQLCKGEIAIYLFPEVKVPYIQHREHSFKQNLIQQNYKNVLKCTVSIKSTSIKVEVGRNNAETCFLSLFHGDDFDSILLLQICV